MSSEPSPEDSGASEEQIAVATLQVPVTVDRSGTVTAPIGTPGLRQRFKMKMDDVSKEMEEMSVKLKRKVSST